MSALAFLNFENSYTNTQVTPTETIGSFTTIDVNAVYDLGKAFASPLTKDFTVTLHVNNLFDRNPPYVNIPVSANGGGGFDPGAASAVGRLVSIGLRKKF